MIHRADQRVSGAGELESILKDTGVVSARLRASAHALTDLIKPDALRGRWISKNWLHKQTLQNKEAPPARASGAKLGSSREELAAFFCRKRGARQEAIRDARPSSHRRPRSEPT
jgi:hypothetical protein